MLAGIPLVSARWMSSALAFVIASALSSNASAIPRSAASF